jgi:metallo-beta-lactamase family protein
MKITLYGAAGDVTGTAYYLKTKQAAILIDCGMFQGGKDSELRNKKAPPVDYKRLDAIILTHAHLDHCGRLPLAIKEGYDGPVYATPATMELTELILRDSLKVQNSDLEKKNRRLRRNGKPEVEPLFREEHVEKVIHLMRPLPYHDEVNIATGIHVTADEAGHIMGSATLKVTVRENKFTRTVVFSGDLGPYGMAIVRDAENFTAADLVFMESTYGDRDHKPLPDTLREMESIIRQALKTRGKILVPSFAVGRTQDLLYYLEQAFANGELPPFPVYIDSPMAIEATRIYMSHPELFDEEMTDFSREGELMKYRGYIHPTPTPEESKRLNDIEGPCMIIAGSGMCNAGRIQHHLRHNLWKPEAAVLIVGYQAEGTLGRRLVDGASWVNIWGEHISVKAQIHKLGGFSAHAGQSDLLRWFDAIAPSRPKVALTHGEDRARGPLAKLITERYGIIPLLPKYGDIIKI